MPETIEQVGSTPSARAWKPDPDYVTLTRSIESNDYLDVYVKSRQSIRCVPELCSYARVHDKDGLLLKCRNKRSVCKKWKPVSEFALKHADRGPREMALPTDFEPFCNACSRLADKARYAKKAAAKLGSKKTTGAIETTGKQGELFSSPVERPKVVVKTLPPQSALEVFSLSVVTQDEVLKFVMPQVEQLIERRVQERVARLVQEQAVQRDETARLRSEVAGLRSDLARLENDVKKTRPSRPRPARDPEASAKVQVVETVLSVLEREAPAFCSETEIGLALTQSDWSRGLVASLWNDLDLSSRADALTCGRRAIKLVLSAESKLKKSAKLVQKIGEARARSIFVAPPADDWSNARSAFYRLATCAEDPTCVFFAAHSVDGTCQASDVRGKLATPCALPAQTRGLCKRHYCALALCLPFKEGSTSRDYEYGVKHGLCGPR